MMNPLRLHAQLLYLVGAVSVSACDDRASVGQHETDSDPDGGQAEGGDTEADTGANEDGGEGGGSGGGTASGGDEAGGSDSAGGEGGVDPECLQDNECLALDGFCEESNCGALTSFFDEQGCYRTPCFQPDECDDGQRCFIALDYGGCVGSSIFCELDETAQQCVCGGTLDCGGGFCVPESIFPVEYGSAEGDATVGCGAADEPVLYLRLGRAPACGDFSAAQGELVLEINAEDGFPAVGEFPVGSGSPRVGTVRPPQGDSFEFNGMITITDVTEDSISGRYSYRSSETDETTEYGSFSELTLCPSDDLLCG